MNDNLYRGARPAPDGHASSPFLLPDEEESAKHGRTSVHPTWVEGATSPSFEQDLEAAAITVPHGVFCLSSAAALHGLLPRTHRRFLIAMAGKVAPDGLAGSVSLIRWTFPGALERGVEDASVGTTRIRVTSSPRTVVDLLRFARHPGCEETALIAGRAFLMRGGHPRDLKEVAAATGTPASVTRLIEFLKLYYEGGAT